jgi:hypothetical protein
MDIDLIPSDVKLGSDFGAKLHDMRLGPLYITLALGTAVGVLQVDGTIMIAL